MLLPAVEAACFDVRSRSSALISGFRPVRDEIGNRSDRAISNPALGVSKPVAEIEMAERVTGKETLDNLSHKML